MKILELRFKNLNSLYGEWFIDFTNPEYLSNGVFALTGPTGSGKTTILDAICLALYGATPRLGKLTGSSNDLMSKQSADCYSELLFESQLGRYRCNWSQHRARRRADGKLSNPKHEISHADSGEIIETKKSLVQSIIEEKTGMDFERFTRSIMLSQGDFDAFLKADTEQKSKLLEQITGTEIYSEISRCVHEKRREENEKLAFLRAEISGVTVLTPQQEEEILHNLESEKKLETELSAKYRNADADITRLVGINSLKKDISSISGELEKLELEIRAFAPDRKRLALSIKAAELDGDYANLAAVRRQQEADSGAMKNARESLPELQHAYNRSRAKWNSAEEEIKAAKARLQEAASSIIKTRALDQRIMEIKRRIDICISDCKEDEIQLKHEEGLKTRELRRRDRANETLKIAMAYLEEHSADKWLLGNLKAIESRLNDFFTLRQELESEKREEQLLKGALLEKDRELEGNSEVMRMQKQEVKNVHHALEESMSELKKALGNKLLREYRSEKEILLREAAYLAGIEELKVQREQLEDGKPCPLCGATEHPFAEGGTPKPTELDRKIAGLTEIIAGAEEMESRIESLKEKETETRKKLTESEKLEIAMAKDGKSLREKLLGLSERLEKAENNLSTLGAGISEALGLLGISRIPNSDAESLLDSLRQRQKKWLAALEKKAGLEEEISKTEVEIKKIDAVFETRVAELRRKRGELERHRGEYQSARDERGVLFGDKDVDFEENRLNGAINKAELGEKKLRYAHGSAREELAAINTSIASLEESTAKRASEIAKLESHFTKTVLRAGFASELDFQNSRLRSDERDMLSLAEKKLDSRLTELRVRKRDRETRLKLEISKTTSKASLEEMQVMAKKLEESLRQTREKIIELNSKLAENATAKKRIEEKKEKIAAQELECVRWEKLHGLIGSADGKKYRNFAQGLTFELLLSHSNRQLSKLSDRYLLIHDKENPLASNVIDTYQADEIRPIRNLSGGESFIVSLALALGLSKMSSKNVRVDSLFLDEGFGTLDEDSLETALEFISGLRQDGKLIGIISHLPQLKECIRTQITVSKLYGGRSILSGPGCNSR